jgi:hypothetical protein
MLFSLSEENKREKEKFMSNMEDHKFKEEGIISSKLSNLPESLTHEK